MVQAQDGLAGWLVKSIPQGFLRSLWLSEREQPEGRVSGHPASATHTAPCQRAKTENKCSAILWIFYHLTSLLSLGRYLCLLVWRYRTVNYCSITQSQIPLDTIKGIGQGKLKITHPLCHSKSLWSFFCGTQKMFWRMFAMLFSLQWKWIRRKNENTTEASKQKSTKHYMSRHVRNTLWIEMKILVKKVSGISTTWHFTNWTNLVLSSAGTPLSRI